VSSPFFLFTYFLNIAENYQNNVHIISLKIDSTYYKDNNRFWGGYTLGTVNGGFFGMCVNEIKCI